MELPNEVITGLKYLSDGNITFPNFKRIVESVFYLAVGGNKFEKVGQICPEKREVAEQAYASLLTFAVHAAQVDADEETVKEALQSCGLKEDRIKVISGFFSEFQTQIADKLSRIKSLPPTIIDVNWKLDYIIKTNTKSHVGEAQYLIVLTTEKNGKIDYVRFICDQHQLQELATKLKEIVHQIDKFSSS